VGSTFDGATTKTLVEHWNGASWSIVASPNQSGATDSSLSRVSCPSATRCYAAGSYFADAPGGKTLVEQWNGTTWSIVPSPNPSGPTDSSLNSVSCASTTNCYAVGSYSTPTSGKTLVEQWNGTTWSIIPSPNASGATDSILTSVACPST